MSDIVERLKDARSVDGSAIMCELPFQVTEDAIAEIERLRDIIGNLRQIAGAASIELPLMPFADIKKEVRK